MSENIFIDGIRIDPPHEKAPSFIKGKLGIKVDTLINFLMENQNDRGYVNCDLKESKEGKLYLTLNNYKKPV